MSEYIFEMAALADELEEFIRFVIPMSEAVKKYGGTLYTLKPEEKEGQFCGVFVHAKHVQISFSRGVELDDPKKILSGSGKLRRHLNFVSSENVDFTELKQLLQQAATL